MRLFPATNIGVYICANGPGAIMHFPQLHHAIYSIFDLVNGNTSTNASSVLENKRSLKLESFVQAEWGKEHRTTRKTTVLKSNQFRKAVRSEELLGLYGNSIDGNK